MTSFPVDRSPPALTRFVSHATGVPLDVTVDGDAVCIAAAGEGPRTRWRLRDGAGDAALSCTAAGADLDAHAHAALEAVTALGRHRTRIALPDAGTVERAVFWQQAAHWLPAPHAPYPQHFTMTGARRHPQRAPKPAGTVYRRGIPWLGRTLSFRTVEVDRDLPLVHRWMNDPDVNHFWQEAGDEARHRAYLAGVAGDPHTLALIGSFDHEPFGYFEVYWAKENRIAPFYDADDFDRGWHVLIGEPSFRGKDFATAWLTSISHYLFLSDPRTRRVVGEPRADHAQQLRNLDKSGYAKVKEFDFPHKRAMLVMLLREHYFGGAYWWPRSDEAITSIPSQS